jgi:hypothetical protein
MPDSTGRIEVTLAHPNGLRRSYLMPAGTSAKKAYTWGVEHWAWPDSVFVTVLLDPDSLPKLFSHVQGKDRCP